MLRTALPLAATAALLAACSSAPGTAYDIRTDPQLAGERPGSIVYSDSWKPGWLYDEDDSRYYVIVPPR